MNRTTSLVSLAAILTAAVFIVGCASRAQSTVEQTATPVRTAAAIESERGLEIRTVGTLRPSTVVPLSFKIGGPVAEVLVDVGDDVLKGQLLATLYTDEIDALLAQAKAAVRKAERDAGRMQSLYADSIVSLAQLQDAETGLEIARAQESAAAFNRAYAEIRAPAAGRILSREIESGQIASSGRQALRLGVSGAWSVFADVSDVDVVNLAVGDEAALSFDAFRGDSLRGRIVEIAETPDPRTGTFEIELSVNENDRHLRAGFIARVAVYPASSDRLTMLPAEALVRAEGAAGTVFVVGRNGGVVEKRSVTIAGLLENRIAVRAGVAPGERVVTDGANYLYDGARITIEN